MSKKSSFSDLSAKILALLLLVTGGLFALYTLLMGSSSYPAIVQESFLDKVPVALDWVNFGSLSFPIEVDNYLIFQEFQSLAPRFTIKESYLFGGVVFLVSVSVLALFSTFRKVPFLIAGAAWIILLTLSNPNELSIGSPNSNIPLLFLIAGSLLPVIYFHVWGTSVSFWKRWILVLMSLGSALFALIYLSPVTLPTLYLAEQSLIIGFGMALAWLFWQGHAILSGIYILLARASRNLSLKISFQMIGISAAYFVLLIFLLLDLKGEVDLPFPTFSPLFLCIPIGLLGWISTNEKINQVQELASSPKFLKALFILGFGITFWVIWKLDLSSNKAGEEFFKHLLVYSQLGFSLFFLVYLLSNFLSIMDTGKSVEKVLYKPYSLPYYHLRIGGLITILVVTIYMDAIIAIQANSMTTNILGDYFYQSGKKLQASILYENSWASYRKNPKAKSATAHLLFELNQPTLAKSHLDESLAEVPQVDNILLLSARMMLENKPLEALFYLETGLKQFPGNPFLVNNLALVNLKINKPEEALALLTEHQSAHPILASNLSAIQSKLRGDSSNSAPGADLISKINYVAEQNSAGQNPTDEIINDFRSDLKRESSPQLAMAGFRNLASVQSHSQTSEDIVWVDSLSRQQAFLEYLMQMQETAVIRSLAAGRISESVKNLNGLAFRNPGDAGYYLQLASTVLAQNLDFEKASIDLIAAEEKGYRALRPYHLTILTLGGYSEKATEFAIKYQIPSPEQPEELLLFLTKFNQTNPDKLFDQWLQLSGAEWKSTVAWLLLERKSHGLTSYQLKELGNSLKEKTEGFDKLEVFLKNPDWANQTSLSSLMEYLKIGDELSANPYRTPLILSAADRISDGVAQYELLNSASEFNKDPLLWIRKVQAAKRIGLDNYAAAALQEMSNWLTWDEIELLQGSNY